MWLPTRRRLRLRRKEIGGDLINKENMERTNMYVLSLLTIKELKGKLRKLRKGRRRRMRSMLAFTTFSWRANMVGVVGKHPLIACGVICADKYVLVQT